MNSDFGDKAYLEDVVGGVMQDKEPVLAFGVLTIPELIVHLERVHAAIVD